MIGDKEETGEVCDYVEIKTEMLSGLSDSKIVDWTEIPDMDIDASWLDFGDVFEGSANDVHISTMARGIEIDLRQNLGESLDDIPKQYPVVYDTQL